MAITRFVWDPVSDCVLQELDGSNNVTVVYTNEPQPYGGVLSQRRGSTTHILHTDALGSTRALSDSSQTVTDTYVYDAWGNLVASTGSTVNPNRWVGRYGYYTESSTGLVYVRARMCQPTVARWCSVDPIGFRDGINRFRYAQSNPMSLVDMSGLICGPCCCCVEGITGPWGVDLDPSTVNPRLGVGTYFELLVDLQLRPFQQSSPCSLEYWEWSSPNQGERGCTNCWKHNIEGHQEKVDKKTIAWCDLTMPGEARPTTADWCQFVHPSAFPKEKCPSSKSIPLQDTPSIRKTSNNTRNLFFHVVVKSAPECKCWKEEVVWEGCQFIVLDAAGKVQKKEFHSGASSCANFPEFTKNNMCPESGNPSKR